MMMLGPLRHGGLHPQSLSVSGQPGDYEEITSLTKVAIPVQLAASLETVHNLSCRALRGAIPMPLRPRPPAPVRHE
jgi:hypothetical protein